MKTRGWTAVGAGFFLAANLAAADGAPLAGKLHALEKEELASLERLVPRLMEDGDVPGLSLAVVQNGQVVYRRAFGVRDESTGARVDDDTIFEAASLSKPVFAYAVLKLADAGRLDLDAPLAKYLPGDYVEDPRLRSITARRVLSHTTGFPNWRPDGQPLKIHFEPGERFSYSGEGFVYLQKAVENRTGQTLEALMRRLVFEPLRMTNSSYTWQDRFEGRKAIGHDTVGSPLGLRRPPVSNAAASLHTTALDYARFLEAVLDGTGLRKETTAQMIHPQIHVDEGCQNCINTADRASLAGDRLGPGLGSTGDRGRPLSLALGRQRQRLPLLRRRISAGAPGRRRLHQRPRRARRHSRGRRGGAGRAPPGIRVAPLRALGLAGKDLVQGHPRTRTGCRRRLPGAQTRRIRPGPHRGTGQPCRLLAPRQEKGEGSGRGLREKHRGLPRLMERARQPRRSVRRRRPTRPRHCQLRKVPRSQ
ncbi:MAG TPA: serine hydrolase domain-containing protein, partial [Thermoanaerobaculia bacterium]